MSTQQMITANHPTSPLVRQTMIRRRSVLLGGAAAAVLPMLGRAQAAWPSKALRIVVPFTPGGTTDFVTRLVSNELAKQMGQPVVVENRPGGGTVIGVDAVAKSAPDGYSFVTVANSFTVNRTLLPKLPYDTLRDLRPVALMACPSMCWRRTLAAVCASSQTSRRPAQASATPLSAKAPRRISPERC